MSALAAIQREFHAAITGGAPLVSARDLVYGDDALARLHVYANAYFARIHDVLVADFPKLHALLGADAFRALVVPYLRAFPTRHPSLREAGFHLAEFLDDALLCDLARIERARVEAFDGADATPLSRDDVARIAPEEFPALRMHLVPTTTIVELSTNADDIWDAIEDGRAVPARSEVARAVIVWRRDLTVVHRTLDPDELAALRCATFAEVCEQIGDVERALALLLRWLDAGVLSGACE